MAELSVSRRRRGGPQRSSRWALAACAAATAFAVSYGVQRLWSWSHGEPAFAEVVLTGSTPYYWRLAVAGLQAGVTAALVAAGVDDARAELALTWAPVWVPLLVLPLALAMVAVP